MDILPIILEILHDIKWIYMKYYMIHHDTTVSIIMITIWLFNIAMENPL